MPPSLAYGGCTSSCHLELHSEIHQTLQTCWCVAAFVGDLFQSLFNLRSWNRSAHIWCFVGTTAESRRCVTEHHVRKKDHLSLAVLPQVIYPIVNAQLFLLPFGHFKPKTWVDFWFTTSTVEQWRTGTHLPCVLLKQHGQLDPALGIHILTKYFEAGITEWITFLLLCCWIINEKEREYAYSSKVRRDPLGCSVCLIWWAVEEWSDVNWKRSAYAPTGHGCP